MRTTIDGVPVIGVMATSGTGKTTLLRALLPRLRDAGLRVACVKHTHHHIEIDKPGKDSHTLRAAGAQQMLLASPGGWALMVDAPATDGDDFTTLVRHLQLRSLDLVLVEGFKFEDFPKLALHRYDLSGALEPPTDATVIALASNQRPLPAAAVPLFALDDAAGIAAFIIHHCTQLSALRADTART
ncbi:MAG: molybdopterin-guanine dinucleotide biosynthesis protein B [Gammaproteobacteria bacterium]|nr:molybdopterin-guanine dinucleotide biosynthesis protein B [Gammaproteobacteria bacterium]